MTLENKVLVSFSSIIYFHDDDRENGSKICQEIRIVFNLMFSILDAYLGFFQTFLLNILVNA